MKIRKFNSYITENNGISLEYMIFDIDDNLVYNSTMIHMEHLIEGVWTKEDVSTAKFAQIRNDKNNWRIPEDAFSEFRDSGPRGSKAFIEDFKKAISSKAFGPSWNKFVECLVSGYIFCLCTARGHSPEVLREGVEYVIYEYLSEGQRLEMIDNLKNFNRIFGMDDVKDPISNYLDNCDYYGVSSPEFLEIAPGGAQNPEKGKEIAIEMFTKKVHEYAKQIGAKKTQLSFSDDDIRNVDHIEKFMRNELSLKYPMQYNMFDTSKKGEPARRIKVTEKINTNMKHIKRFNEDVEETDDKRGRMVDLLKGEETEENTEHEIEYSGQGATHFENQTQLIYFIDGEEYGFNLIEKGVIGGDTEWDLICDIETPFEVTQDMKDQMYDKWNATN